MNFIPSSMTRREMLGIFAGAMLAGCSPKMQPGSGNQPAAELILCGGDEVFVMAISGDAEVAGRKTWSWRAEECPDIPEALKRSFRSTDDCKPVDGGRSILISSSSGAVALVDRQTRRARFWAPVVNAHSIEMLPKGRIAAAASTGTSPLANRVIIFDLASMRELAADGLVSAHGVVWDDARQVLWALGKDELRAYTLTDGADGAVILRKTFEATLPDSDGHDLSPAPGTSRLFISTGRKCWYFDRATRQFLPHDMLADAKAVKSCSVHSATGRVCYVQAEGKEWWAQRVHFTGPKGVLHLPGQRLYKARWMAAAGERRE